MEGKLNLNSLNNAPLTSFDEWLKQNYCFTNMQKVNVRSSSSMGDEFSDFGTIAKISWKVITVLFLHKHCKCWQQIFYFTAKQFFFLCLFDASKSTILFVAFSFTTFVITCKTLAIQTLLLSLFLTYLVIWKIFNQTKHMGVCFIYPWLLPIDLLFA